MNGAIVIGPWDLLVAAALLIIPAVISISLRLGLHKSLAIAAIRTTLQLALLGLVLDWVFALNAWYSVLAILFVMLVAASRAAINRSKHRFSGAVVLAFVSLVVATAGVTLASTQLVLDLDPWWRPQYVIPLMGMLLGNGLTGISLSLDRILNDLVQKRPEIEARLALGASPWRALLPCIREAVRTGMIPIINTMMIVGLVSLPGMMTGQILAGADPADAVAYQILIMFMIASATSLGTILLVLGVFKALLHPEQRFQWDRIS